MKNPEPEGDSDYDTDDAPSKPKKPKKASSGMMAAILVIIGVAAVSLVLIIGGAVVLTIWLWPTREKVAQVPVQPRPEGVFPKGPFGPDGMPPKIGMPPVDPPGAGPAVGAAAPDIEAADMDGKRFKLSDYRGKVVLLDFWNEF